jgi:cytochrome P450
MEQEMSQLNRGQCPPGVPVVPFFDHNTAEYAAHRLRWYEEIRQTAGPVFWSPHYGGFWAVIGFNELLEACKSPERFSSKHLPGNGECPVDGGRYLGLFAPPRPQIMPLIEDDSPQWDRLRTIMMPLFSMPAMERLRGRIQEIVDAFLDRHIESGRIDFAADLVNILPAIYTLELLGLPTNDFMKVARNHHVAGHIMPYSPEWAAIGKELAVEADMIRQTIAERRNGSRGKDVISGLLNAQDRDAGNISDDEIFRMVQLIIGAGIDTTASVLAQAFVILTEQPEIRRELAADPSLIRGAFDEFVRVSVPTQGLFRTVTGDTELGGQKLKKGDRLMLCFAAACRDPSEYQSAGEVRLERSRPTHAGFGAGPHQCLGRLFARVEFEVILQTVLRRMPDFEVDVSRVVTLDSVGISSGFVSVPATFTPGRRLGVDPNLAGFSPIAGQTPQSFSV